MCMHTVEVLVGKQRGGYNFVLLPDIRDMIRALVPSARPATNIFVGYEWRTDFEKSLQQVESYIYPALLGINSKDDLKSIDAINFVDSETGKVLHTIRP